MRVQSLSVAALRASLALLATVSPALAQQPRPMTIVDLINVPTIASPQLSPDGSQVVYALASADWKQNETVTHLWRTRADGTGLVQLTSGDNGESSPAWSPDGSRIAFVTRRGDDRAAQVYLIHNAGGEGLRLSQHPTAVSSITWSPDGQWIYFLAEEDKTAEEKAREQVNDNVFAFDENWKHRHLWRISVPDGREERVTGGDFSVRGFELSRDGSLVLHSRVPTPRLDDSPNAELWLMGSTGQNARRLTENAVGESGAQLSPDNSRLLFVSGSNQELQGYHNSKIFVMPVAGGRPEVLLPELPHEVNGASWSADGRSIYFLANTGVRQDLFQVDVASRKVTQLTRGDHAVDDWSYDPALRRHVFTVSSPTNAGDLYTLDAGRAEPRRVTRLYDHLARDFRLPKVEAVQWKGEDGVSVEGLLFYPLDYQEGRRYPLVVQTHGGPQASDQFGWFSVGSYEPVLAAKGYFVLQPNYRGSTGYGDAFLRDMIGHYFNQAHKDVMAGVDYLIGRGLVDGERLAKMGWSAGGHMTNKLITFTDRFKAASSGAGAINWISMYGQSDTRVQRTAWFGGTPWQENAPIEAYLAASPLMEIHKATTPTLVLVGQNDERVPMPQSVELYRALKSNGVPTKLYVAPRQGHGWRELQQRLFKANVELDWFERYVMGREYTWELSPVHPAAASAQTTQRP